MKLSKIVGLSLCVIAAGCGDADPRYGEASVSSGAPRVTLSGTTFGQAAALELAPGCPGYLDVDQPGHVLHVTDEVPFTVQARSDDGPLALAVANGDEVRCDSDEGSGHSPTLSFEGAGDYQVYVAALRQPAELAYELRTEARVAAPGEPVAEVGGGEVSVTITSQPAGAQVTDTQGNVIGTTPAMFVVPLEAEDVGTERTWNLALEGHTSTQVTGTLTDGSLVLHGQLPELGPTRIEQSATDAQPIRDYQTASMAIDVAQSCAITEAEVEVDISHSFVGDLRVVLHAPWGDEMMLYRHQGGGRRNLRRTWSSNGPLRGVVGRPTRGTWTMRVHDDAGADTGTFRRFDLRLTCGPGAVATTPPSPTTGPTPTTTRPPSPNPASNPQGSRLPDLPSRTEIVRVLAALRPNAERCASGQGGQVRVDGTVIGSTGRVSSVRSSGTASGAERACVERVVRGARFSRFRRQSLDITYTYNLPTGARRQGNQREVLDPWSNRSTGQPRGF